jgi:hypothetical protein
MASTQLSRDDNDEIFYVANNYRGEVAFTDSHPITGETVVWKAKGDPGGDDVRPIRGAVLKSIQFQRMLAKGLFEIRTEEEVISQVRNGIDAWDEDDTSLLNALDRQGANEFVDVDCLGPAIKGSGDPHCNEVIPMPASRVPTTPPLCDRHQRFVPYVVFDATSGTWSRISPEPSTGLSPGATAARAKKAAKAEAEAPAETESVDG